MRKTIICLANSKKYGERCIAGIEVTAKPTGGWQIVKENGKPRWLRPVSSFSNHGEVKEQEVADIELLDVVEFDALRQVGRGFQQENILFHKGSLRKISSIGCTTKNLDVLTDINCSCIFDDRNKRIAIKDMHSIQHSLVFLKVESINIYYPVVYKTMNPRAKFLFKGVTYDLPVTDVRAISRLYENPNLLHDFQNFYATFSLGVKFEEYHYKLLAGLIWL